MKALFSSPRAGDIKAAVARYAILLQYMEGRWCARPIMSGGPVIRQYRRVAHSSKLEYSLAGLIIWLIEARNLYINYHISMREHRAGNALRYAPEREKYQGRGDIMRVREGMLKARNVRPRQQAIAARGARKCRHGVAWNFEWFRNNCASFYINFHHRSHLEKQLNAKWKHISTINGGSASKARGGAAP